MPLRDDLLNPIEGENPSGANMRYAPVFDKIKEARREDDDAPQGDWQRERKTADYKTVLKLAQETLATKTKDLQLAAWITEAMLRTEGFSGLRQGLELLRSLMANFWDTVYPENEEGDLELRAAPVEWVGTKLDDAVRKAPLNKSGHNFYQFKVSRTVGYEADATDDVKLQARAAAIAEGKVTADDFDAAVAATPTPAYEAWVATMDACIEMLEEMQVTCEGKFGTYAPAFGPLRTSIEEVRHPINQILQKRLEAEGRLGQPEAEPEIEIPTEYTAPDTSGGAAAPVAKKAAGGSIEPQDMDDATNRLAALAKFLRTQDPYSPAPYLLLRGYRWGELRGYGNPPDPTKLLPPTSEVRQNIRRLSLESNWAELLETAEVAMAQPCGRAWLDLQRYVVRAAEEYGYPGIAHAVKSELRALLTDLPGLPTWTLMDDTPTANAETQAWLAQALPAAPPAAAPAHEAPQMMMEETHAQVAAGEPAPPDTFTMAMDAVRSGHGSDAIQLLADEIQRQHSGRGRFQRKLQLAQICMMTNHEALARPILEDLAENIDAHKLEEWEAADVVAHPLSMLYRTLDKTEDEQLRKKLYSRISRLDPARALECER